MVQKLKEDKLAKIINQTVAYIGEEIRSNTMNKIISTMGETIDRLEMKYFDLLVKYIGITESPSTDELNENWKPLSKTTIKKKKGDNRMWYDTGWLKRRIEERKGDKRLKYFKVDGSPIQTKVTADIGKRKNKTNVISFQPWLNKMSNIYMIANYFKSREKIVGYVNSEGETNESLRPLFFPLRSYILKKYIPSKIQKELRTDVVKQLRTMQQDIIRTEYNMVEKKEVVKEVKNNTTITTTFTYKAPKDGEMRIIKGQRMWWSERAGRWLTWDPDLG